VSDWGGDTCDMCGRPVPELATLRAQVEALRTALLALRDTDDEYGIPGFRLPGPCWCAGWQGTVEHGHNPECLAARRALGLEP